MRHAFSMKHNVCNDICVWLLSSSWVILARVDIFQVTLLEDQNRMIYMHNIANEENWHTNASKPTQLSVMWNLCHRETMTLEWENLVTSCDTNYF